MAGGGERDLRLVGGLLRYWLNRSQLSLGYRLTREALGRTAVAGDDRLRRTALTIAGQLGGQLGLHDQARKMHDEAIDIARRDGDPEELADALNGSGQTRVEQGDLAGARTQIEESLKLATQVGTDSQTFGTAALMLGELERLEGNWIRAQSLYEASLSIARRQGDARRIATNLNNLVMNSIALARSDGVREMLVEAMQHGQQVSIVYGPVFPLMLCAGLATLRGDWEVAARFEGAARFHFAELQWPLDPADRAYLESLSSRTRTALGDSGFGRAREAGRALALDEALAQVRQYLSDQT